MQGQPVRCHHQMDCHQEFQHCIVSYLRVLPLILIPSRCMCLPPCMSAVCTPMPVSSCVFAGQVVACIPSSMRRNVFLFDRSRCAGLRQVTHMDHTCPTPHTCTGTITMHPPSPAPCLACHTTALACSWPHTRTSGPHHSQPSVTSPPQSPDTAPRGWPHPRSHELHKAQAVRTHTTSATTPPHNGSRGTSYSQHPPFSQGVPVTQLQQHGVLRPPGRRSHAPVHSVHGRSCQHPPIQAVCGCRPRHGSRWVRGCGVCAADATAGARGRGGARRRPCKRARGSPGCLACSSGTRCLWCLAAAVLFMQHTTQCDGLSAQACPFHTLSLYRDTMAAHCTQSHRHRMSPPLVHAAPCPNSGCM